MESARSRAQSPFDRFRRDHLRVLTRLTAIEEATGRGRPVDETRLRRHLDGLGRQFDTHMAAEESVFYPVLARTLPATESSLRPLNDEHTDLREMLAALRVTLGRPRSPERDVQIGIQARDLVDLLRAHIRKEEVVVFDVSERVLRPGELRGLHRRLKSFLPARARLAEAGREKGKHGS
ncbi:MAG TPA: hemerythrin domain-containing protein [Candidatus Eisenbacteria bacterium]|nr:hemerythrin domain-containing protein [Candidatus Eisenbacteria bacterium]